MVKVFTPVNFKNIQEVSDYIMKELYENYEMDLNVSFKLNDGVYNLYVDDKLINFKVSFNKTELDKELSKLLLIAPIEE